jgi:hypothetical protein
MYRSGEQVARFLIVYLVRENGEEFASRKGAKHALSAVEGGAKFGEIEVGASKKVDGAEWALASLASWREKNSEEVSPAKAQRAPRFG